MAGPEKYDQLSEHEIPWTDLSVIEVLTEPRRSSATPTTSPGARTAPCRRTSRSRFREVFQETPKAATVYEGDFVAGVITDETSAKAETDFNVFDFPSVNDSAPAVVGGGDMVVKFTDNPAADALIEYLATPEAAEIWAERGGFSSPNKNVDPEVYPDEILKTTATAARRGRDVPVRPVRPDAERFGGDAMFTILQDFLKNPDSVAATAAKLEAAKQAYAS